MIDKILTNLVLCNVIEGKIYDVYFVPGISSDPPRLREYREGGGEGWRRQGRYAKSKLLKTASFIEVETLNIY